MQIVRLTLLITLLITGTSALCNYKRDSLIRYVETYFKALVDNNPTLLPLAKNAKITINGDLKPIAQTFWATAETVAFRFDIVNTRLGDTGTEAVITNSDGTKTMYMLRMKIQGDRIIEIETIKCNKGEADGLWGAEDLTTVSPAYKLSIREVEQDSYYDLIGTAESYWRCFQTNGSPEYRPARLLPDSRRYENGMQTTGMVKDGKFKSTKQEFDIGMFKERYIWDRRYAVVDEERGVVLSIVRFGIKPGAKSNSNATTHNRLVAEFFAIKSGWIQEIQAVLVNRTDEQPTGWEPDYGPGRPGTE